MTRRSSEENPDNTFTLQNITLGIELDPDTPATLVIQLIKLNL